MSYITLDTGFFRHPKVLALGNTTMARTARDLYVAALAYSRSNLTDGFIPSSALGELDPLTPLKTAEKAADSLVLVGLFTRKRGRFTGYYIRDYADHQQTKAEVEQAKAAARERKQRERERKRQAEMSLRDASVTHGVTGASVTPIEAEQKKKNQEPAFTGALTYLDEKELELAKMLGQARDADPGSLSRLRDAAGDCSLAVLAQVRYSAERQSKKVGVGWLINAIRDERKAAALSRALHEASAPADANPKSGPVAVERKAEA